MLRKLENRNVLSAPVKGSDDKLLKDTLEQVFGAINGNDSLVLFFDHNSKSLVFAKMDTNGKVDETKTVGIYLPCPPYCGTDTQNINILTTD